MEWYTGVFVIVIVLFCCRKLLRYVTPRFIDRDNTNVQPTLNRMPRYVCAAHRGGGGEFGPENSMYSYRKAVKQNVDMLEIDVQRTKDNILVLSHDRDLSRTSNGRGLISDKTYDELMDLDLHPADDGVTGAGSKIPKLEAVFDEFSDNEDLIYFLDIKQPGIMDDVLQMLEDKKLLRSKRVLFGAVPPSVGKDVLKKKPKFVPMTPDWLNTFSYAIAYVLGLDWAVPLKHEIFGILYSTTSIGFPFDEERAFISKPFVDRLHARGRKVYAFGVDLTEEKHIFNALYCGVDCLFSDHPHTLKKCIDEFLACPEEERKKYALETRVFSATDVLTLANMMFGYATGINRAKLFNHLGTKQKNK